MENIMKEATLLHEWLMKKLSNTNILPLQENSSYTPNKYQILYSEARARDVSYQF